MPFLQTKNQICPPQNLRANSRPDGFDFIWNAQFLLRVCSKGLIKTKRIAIQLILTTFWALSPIIAAHNQSIDGDAQNDPVSGIIFKNGRFQLDTAIILSNKNLPPLIKSLEKADLQEKKKVAEIPEFIIAFFEEISGHFSMANRGEKWQAGCVVSKPLPSRQLIYFGLGPDIALNDYPHYFLYLL
jgi:hypothetical protein